MIKGTENLQQIIELKETLIHVFEKHGLGSYFKPENLKKIGRFTRLNTLLKSNNIDVDLFVEQLNQIVASEMVSGKADINEQENLHFAAMLPCGLRNPFKEFIEAYLQDNKQEFSYLNYLIEGNVNHELSYYPLLDNIKNENELPDIIMASDVNNFFHRPFIDRFISSNVFDIYAPHKLNNYLEKAAYADPNNNFTMYTANMLVMVVDKNKLADRKMPQKWDDLLAPEFANDIIMRGEDDFFCNAVMLPFFKDGGMDAIHILSKNIKSGLHPAEMVKLAGSNKAEGACVYIMPWFFSKRIKNKNVEIIWPSDGAIASPVFMLVKRTKAQQHKALLDFLLCEKTAQMLIERYFPATHPTINHSEMPETVKWLGWDFLNKYDIGKLKEDIKYEFEKYRP